MKYNCKLKIWILFTKWHFIYSSAALLDLLIILRAKGNYILLSSNYKGYTLYLVLLVLSIASVIFSISIADIRSIKVKSKMEVQKRQAKLLSESGIIRTEFFLNGGDGHNISWETPGYDEGFNDYGNIHLKVQRFGFFSRVISIGRRITVVCTTQGLFGRTAPPLLSPSLTLTGHIGGLILQKGAFVEGEIVLHHGYVYDKKNGYPLPDYTRRLILRESPSLPFDTTEMPAIYERYSKYAEEHIRGANKLSGTIIIADNNDSLLKRTPLVVNGDCRILTNRCRNAIIIVSGLCTIETGAMVVSSLCCAERIICEGGMSNSSLFFAQKTISVSGGIHNSQFLAKDTIKSAASAFFGSMNLFAGYREEIRKDTLSFVSGGVIFDNNTRIRGTVICCTAPGIKRNILSPSIIFGKGCKVSGYVITDGDCYLYECDIAGRLWARAIIARDTEGSYINYMFGSTIRFETADYCFPLLGDIPVKIVFKPSS